MLNVFCNNCGLAIIAGVDKWVVNENGKRVHAKKCEAKRSPAEEIIELDDFWRAALTSTDAPDVIVCLNERLQRACQEVMDTEDELRDWARQHMPKK